MDCEWHEAKNEANIRKHGISFEIARQIFEGPVLTRTDNRIDYGEVRYNSIGHVGQTLLIVVSHTERDGRTRLISARRATRRERLAYRKWYHEGGQANSEWI